MTSRTKCCNFSDSSTALCVVKNDEVVEGERDGSVTYMECREIREIISYVCLQD